MANTEMTIPKSRAEIVWTGFFSLIVVVFALLALLNLTNRIALIPSVLWLIIVAWIIWVGSRDAGGIRRYLFDWLGVFVGRRFVLSSHQNAHQTCIRFGYKLFGHRFYQKEVEIERIESVQWSPGQATSMAGRDMKDWSVALWYDHGDPEKSKKHHMLRKPDQDVYIVGPARPKEVAATLGAEFVSFLSHAGVTLVRGEGGNVYVRQT